VVFHNIRFRCWFKFSDGYLKAASYTDLQTLLKLPSMKLI